ncbi:MAG: transglycosylase SLT domain-containing protein [Microgenomates group bacterium]
MRISWKHFFLAMLITAVPLSILITINAKEQTEVLSQIVETTPEPAQSPTPTPTEEPTPIPTEKPTPTLSPTPTISPSPTPEPLPPVSPEEIHGFIERFAAQYGVDPNVLRHIAVCESEFNPLAINNSYVGLFQFGPITWANNRKAMGEDPNPDLRLNAEESAQTAAYILSTRGGGVWPNCLP